MRGGEAIESLLQIPDRAHDLLTGLLDDDHIQYVLRLGSIADITTRTHSLLTGLAADDHGLYQAGTEIRKTVDEIVNNSVVLQNDNELVLPVTSNSRWAFRLYIRASSPTGVPDIRYAFAIPAGATLERISNFNAITEGTVQPPSDGTNPTPLLGVGATAQVCLVWYSYSGGANGGAVQLQWAQNVATAEDTKVLAGSHIVAQRFL